jgi:hypothetical protein
LFSTLLIDLQAPSDTKFIRLLFVLLSYQPPGEVFGVDWGKFRDSELQMRKN